MRLSVFLKNEKPCVWAAYHKISPSVISRYLRYRGGMSPENAIKVEKASKRKVKAWDILMTIVKNNRR